MGLKKQILLLVVTLLGLAAPVSAIEYGGIGGKPANPDPNNSRSESIFIYEIKPGQSKKDAVTVSNNTTEAKTIAVYAVDGQTTNTGSFACEQAVEDADNVGGWIKLAKDTIRLAPNTRETVQFTLTLPETVSVGEHNGCIVIEQTYEESAQQSGNIALSFRSALRVAIRVPGDIKKSLEFIDFTAQREGAEFVYAPSLRNSGNVSLDTEVNVRVTNLFGRQTYQNGGQFPILPEDEASFRFTMPEPFWGGVYRASASASFNDNPDVGIGEQAGNNKTISRSSGWFIAWPQPKALAIELGVLLLLIGLIVFGLLKRRKIVQSRRHWQTYTVKESDALTELAAKHNVSWKRVARVNNLKAPYALSSGDKLKLPIKLTKQKRPKKA